MHLFSGDLWAGAEVMTYNLIKELMSQGNINIIAVSLNEGVLADKLKTDGVETYVVSESQYSLPVIFIKCLKILRMRKIDVFHSHRYKENVLALLLGKMMGVKCLINTLHGLPELPTNNKYNLMKFALKLNNQIIKRFFTFTVSVSNEIKDILTGNFDFDKNKVHVIYNGIPEIDPVYQKKKRNDGWLCIGTVGRLVHVKNFTLFLQMAAKIKNKINNVRFSILGDGPLRDELLQESRKLGLDSCFTLLPPTENPLPYYQSLDVYVNTSIHEGIPLSVLEAMGCKKTVVAPDVGGIPEIISNGRNGFLVQNHDSEQYKEVCLSLLHDAELRENIGDNAYNSVLDKFSVSKMAGAYTELYRSCQA